MIKNQIHEKQTFFLFFFLIILLQSFLCISRDFNLFKARSDICILNEAAVLIIQLRMVETLEMSSLLELLTSRVESSHESKTLNFKVLFIKLEYN